MNAATMVVFRYAPRGSFPSTITATLAEIAEETAAEAIMTRIDSDLLEAGITWEVLVDSLTLSSPIITTGEPGESLDHLCTILDALASSVSNDSQEG